MKSQTDPSNNLNNLVLKAIDYGYKQKHVSVCVEPKEEAEKVMGVKRGNNIFIAIVITCSSVISISIILYLSKLQISP